MNSLAILNKNLILISVTSLVTACTTVHEPAPVEIHRPGEFVNARPGADSTPQFVLPEGHVSLSSPLAPESLPTSHTRRVQISKLEPLPNATPLHQDAPQDESLDASVSVEPVRIPTEDEPSLAQDQVIKPAPLITTDPREPLETTAPQKPRVLPKPKNILAPTPQALLATPGLKFLWPAHGKITTGFGPTDDGSRNEGLNIALPKGTPVRASEAGRVVFVGEKVKGFGKLILLTHTHGWSSAYAHLDKVNVVKGQKIKRGQVIAFSGQSGTVSVPQLHFELRQDIQAVDPQPYLEH